LSEARCYQLLRQARWPNGIVCPHCRQMRVTTHSKFTTTSRRRYLCLECRRTFTDLTGTPFARTNLSLCTWFHCLDLIGQGLRTSELAKKLSVKWDTTAYMVRRVAKQLKQPGLIQKLCEAAKERRFE
jgi:transposase-like protein